MCYFIVFMSVAVKHIEITCALQLNFTHENIFLRQTLVTYEPVKKKKILVKSWYLYRLVRSTSWLAGRLSNMWISTVALVSRFVHNHQLKAKCKQLDKRGKDKITQQALPTVWWRTLPYPLIRHVPCSSQDAGNIFARWMLICLLKGLAAAFSWPCKNNLVREARDHWRLWLWKGKRTCY